MRGFLALLLPERLRDVETHINQIIEEASSTAHLRTEQQLQTCLDLVKNRGNADHSQDEVERCTEAYFYARLYALQGKSAVTGRNHEQAPWRNALRIGGVEHRAAGTFFQPLGSQQSSAAPLGLSYARIGQGLPGRDAGLPSRDSIADWIERGIEDGLRDRSAVPGKLRRYAPVM